MFNKFLAVVLIVCLQCLNIAGLVAAISFKMNKEYIAAKLCENRAKPKLNCMGKCYLKKMQKKAEEQKEANDNALKDVFYLLANRQTTEPLQTFKSKNHYTIKNNNEQAEGWLRQYFHPPGFC